MDLYQIVYCSKNGIQGTPVQVEAEIQSILASARQNNQPSGVTGALLFNGTAFAQVLEGPLGRVAQIFEQIQCDQRHSDVTILRNAACRTRAFSEWSMAFADPKAVRTVSGAETTLAAAFADPSEDGMEIIGLLQQLVNLTDD